MRVAIALVLMATTPSCALLANANASHSRISGCVDNPAFAVVDLVIAGAITGGLAASGTLDQSVAWLLLPSVFAASGVLGAIAATSCAGETAPKSGGSYENLPVSAPYKLPENVIEIPDVTSAERGPPPPAEVKPGVKLTLDPDYKLQDPPPKAKEPSGPIECDASASQCPPNHGCSLGSNGRGVCRKNKDR